MSSIGKKANILKRLLEHCQKRTRMAIGFLEVDDDVYECPSDPAKLMGLLTEEFSVEELCACGIANMEDAAGGLVPAITDGDAIIVMRDPKTNEPFELLTKAGCLSPGSLPTLEILCDHRTQRMLKQSDGDLFVAFEIEDVVILRACGLPATLAVGLDDLPLEKLDQFCESFSLSCLKSERCVSREEAESEHKDQSAFHPDDPIRRMAMDLKRDQSVSSSPSSTVAGPDLRAQSSPAQLVLIGWKPSELSVDVPSELKAVVDHLDQLNRFMRVEVYEIGLWQVDEERVEQLRFIAERHNADCFETALLDALDEIDVSIVHFGKKKLVQGPPADYPTALTRLQEGALSDGGLGFPGPDQRKDAWSDVQRLLNKQIVNPLREAALTMGDPVQRTLLMSMAEISNVFHAQTALVGEQLNRKIVDGSDQLPVDQFKNLMAMADRLIDIAKATKRCTQLQSTIIESQTLDSPSIPLLRHSKYQ